MINTVNTSILFPGQGSQVIGMGKELCETFGEAKEVFLTVDEILKQNLSKLIFSGHIDELTATQNAQPAIMTVSMAVIRVLEKELKKPFNKLCSVTAGHSLGEYSALCAAGAFSLENTAALLRIRGNAMNSASSDIKCGMLALIGADLDSTENLISTVKEFGICEIANDNGASQIVLSGEVSAIDKAAELAKDFNVKKAIKLKVSAPFHSSLMTEAAIVMQKALSDIVINQSSVPVIANYSASPVSEPAKIKNLLVKQVAGRVRWRETMERLLDTNHITNFVEVGPGQVLTTIAKRISSNANVFNLETPSSIENFVANF